MTTIAGWPKNGDPLARPCSSWNKSYKVLKKDVEFLDEHISLVHGHR